MGFSIGFLAMSTLTTSATGVSRIDLYNRKTHICRLVEHEEFELRESPVPHKPAHLGGITVRTISNPCEVFKRECLPCQECGLYKLLADVMVCPMDKPRLFAGDGAEPSLCTLLAAPLKRSTELPVTTAAILYRFTRKGVAFAVGGDIRDTEIDAENARGFDGRRFRLTNRDGKRELSVVVEQIHLADVRLACQMFALVGAAVKTNLLSALHRCHAGIGDTFKTEHAFIVNYSREGAEEMADRLVGAVTIEHFADSANNQLRRQSKLLAAGMIAGSVKRNLPKGFLPEGDFTDPVAGGVELPEHIEECNGLFTVRRHFDFDSSH